MKGNDVGQKYSHSHVVNRKSKWLKYSYKKAKCDEI